MNEFFNKIAKNTYYKKLIKNPFTYVTGAVLLSRSRFLPVPAIPGA